MKNKAKIGEIWVTLIPKIYSLENGSNLQVVLEKRPCLIIDAGQGFLIEENSNYMGLKLTTKTSKKSKVYREEISNWKEIGLHKKSYLRIEIPLKIEDKQLITKIGEIDKDKLKYYLKLFASYFNIEVLNKYANLNLDKVAS